MTQNVKMLSVAASPCRPQPRTTPAMAVQPRFLSPVNVVKGLQLSVAAHIKWCPHILVQSVAYETSFLLTILPC